MNISTKAFKLFPAEAIRTIGAIGRGPRANVIDTKPLNFVNTKNLRENLPHRDIG